MLLRPDREDAGEPIAATLSNGMPLSRSTVTVHGAELHLIVPRDVDAVMDMYIAAGEAVAPSFEHPRMPGLHQLERLRLFGVCQAACVLLDQ